ncbi:MAG: hypothetical protein ACR2IE_08770 [Candidatus Sumerlaeaceae bacterium]
MRDGLITKTRCCRGGATFTLLIFVLLLISTGLMYYYFHRCRVLEAEVTKWKSGLKEREAPVQVAAPVVVQTKKKETLRDFAANLGARLTGTPAAEPVEKSAPAQQSPAPASASTETRKSSNETPRPETAPDAELPAPETPTAAASRSTPRPEVTRTPTPAPAPRAENSARAKKTPITSLYDLQAAPSPQPGGDEPAVRVRAPKRTATPATRLNLNDR